MSEEIEEPIEECVCSLCGATVVPEAHDTSRGVRYRCPECRRFMKPLKPEDAEEIEGDGDEASIEDPKEGARRMLRRGKHTIEEIMSETGLSKPVVTGLKGALAKKGELPSQREREEGEEEARAPLLPDDIAITERVKELLAKELPTVYGIPLKQKSGTIIAVLDTITPDTVRDPLILHNHVKHFAKNANDRHLEAVIAKIYSRLSEEGYLSRDDEYTPLYSSIRRGRGKPTKRYSSLRRGLGIRDEEVEEHEAEGYRGRQSQRMKIVVDGQEVETDFEGLMAWKRWKQEANAEERRREEHQLRMKKLEAEITKIYNDAQGGTNLEDDNLRRQLDDEKEKRHQAQQERLGDQIQRLSEEVKKQPPFLEQLKYFKQAGLDLGMKTTGRTTLDLFADGIDKFDNRAAQLLQRVPGPSSEFKPQVTRTANERKEKAQEIMSGLDKTEEVLEVENALIEAASKVKGSS